MNEFIVVTHIINLIVFAIIIPLWYRVRKLQDNEIHDIKDSLRRIENQLTDHLYYHLKDENEK